MTFGTQKSQNNVIFFAALCQRALRHCEEERRSNPDDKAGISSIRVNDKYRIEFTVNMAEEPLVTICNVLELSNHYK